MKPKIPETSIDTGLHTNKAINMKKIEKAKNSRLSVKSEKAIASGDVQRVIDSLPERQRRFVEEYLVDLNATQAVTRSGYNTQYPSRIAYQLMENQAIRIAIDALRAQRTKNSDVTKDFVLKGIQKAIRLAEEAGNLNALLRGHELLARHLGMFVERTEISGPDGGAIKHEKIEEDVADFTRRIASIANKGREG